MTTFLDVTGSCRSARNTGVQRVTRQIYRALTDQPSTSVVPICWNRLGNFYHLLGPREFACLSTPFKKYSAPQGRPEFRGEKFPGEVRRFLGRKPIDLRTELQSGHALLVPDVYYSDRRTNQLPEVIRQSKGRSVGIFHDAATLHLRLFSRAAADRFRRYVESLAVFDLIICISKESETDLVELWENWGISDPPPTCVEGWPLGFEEKERSFERHSSRNVVLCVGSFDARKNHVRLLEAVDLLWEEGLQFELQLVGRSTGALGYKIVPRIRLLQAKGRPLWWLKHIDDRALHHAYRECKFTVYPSLAEGFGLPILESLWHGKPCVCGSNGALGEAAQPGGCLLVDQTNVIDLADGIRRLLTDEEKYSVLSTEASLRKFRSWPNYTGDLLKYLGGIDAAIGNAEPARESLRPAKVLT
jgi:glycosyltransferase involved in cell wall biosynthesis